MSIIILLSAKLIHSRDPSPASILLYKQREPLSATLIHGAQRVCKQACEVPDMQESISQKQDVASFFLHISLIILF